MPPSRRRLAEIQADDRLSNGARRLAAHLDGRCLAPGKWAAWPKVSTIAAELGWAGDPRAFRKRVERYFRELIESGDVARPRLGELVAWHDAQGAPKGLAWPAGLRRNLCRSAAICVLGWKLAEAEARLPILTPCDISVATNGPATPGNVASHPPEMSHGDPPKMSHPQNVRTPERETEPNVNVAASGPGGGGQEPETWPDAPPVPAIEAAPPAAEMTGPPAAPGSPPVPVLADRPPTDDERAWLRALAGFSPRERAEKLRARLRDDGVMLRPGVGDSIAWEGGATFRGFPPEAAYWMRRLKPELLAILRPEAEPTASAAGDGAAGPATARPATRPCRAASATARGLIGGLPGNPDPGSELVAARAIAAAIGDHKPKSLETFAWYAGEVRRGDMPVDWLMTAFERSCSRTAQNRGKVLVGTIQRFKDRAPGTPEDGATTPAEESP